MRPYTTLIGGMPSNRSLKLVHQLLPLLRPPLPEERNELRLLCTEERLKDETSNEDRPVAYFMIIPRGVVAKVRLIATDVHDGGWEVKVTTVGSELAVLVVKFR